MKKMIAALLSTIIITLATAGIATAQTGDRDIAFIPAKNHAAYISFVNQNSSVDKSTLVTEDAGTTKNDTKASLKAVKANNRALKAFNASYKDAANASWSIAEGGMIASFSKDDVKTDVVYTSRGKWFHTLTYYPGDKAPKDVMDMMDDAFPKDEVRLTVQVEEGGTTFYIVQLEGKTTLKKVTIYNGEINVIEALTKSK